MTAGSSFGVGDRVLDAQAEDPEPMYVLDPARGSANDVYIEALEATVADVNPESPADDPVVSCVHETWLAHNVGDRWRGWRDEDFAARLREFASEWGLSIRSYDYPESRLTAADEDPNEEVETRSATDADRTDGQTSMDDWLEG